MDLITCVSCCGHTKVWLVLFSGANYKEVAMTQRLQRSDNNTNTEL